jgi:hypothetical protein
MGERDIYKTKMKIDKEKEENILRVKEYIRLTK